MYPKNWFLIADEYSQMLIELDSDIYKCQIHVNVKRSSWPINLRDNPWLFFQRKTYFFYGYV